jgi:hypothetical protein
MSATTKIIHQSPYCFKPFLFRAVIMTRKLTHDDENAFWVAGRDACAPGGIFGADPSLVTYYVLLFNDEIQKFPSRL